MANEPGEPHLKASNRNPALVLLLIAATVLIILIAWRFYLAMLIVKFIFSIIFGTIKYLPRLFGAG